MKNAEHSWHSHPARDAAHRCLSSVGLTMEDLDAVFYADDLERPHAWIDWTCATAVNHHACHAAAAFFPAHQPRSTLLVVDGHGGPLDLTDAGWEVETISVGFVDGVDLELGALQTGVQRLTSSSWQYVTQHSIGWFYEIVTDALGFGSEGQGKTMGLAAFGTHVHLDALRSFIEIGSDGRFWFDPYGGIWDWLVTTMKSASNPFQVRADIAFAAQEVFGDAVVAAANEAHRRAPSEVLSFGGGCALNTLANSRILAETPFERLCIFPASGDNGLAVGAALYGSHIRLRVPRPERPPDWRAKAVYTGPPLADAEIDVALEGAPVFAERPDDLPDAVARTLVRGETVAVCRGGSEIGPRALGHRSLLALPGPARMRDHINLNIKQRESFRPLAPMVPIEDVGTYFMGIVESPYMLLVADVVPEHRDQLGAVTHVDGTARVQTVRSEDEPFLHRLLRCVGDATGVPVILNTSLNRRGEPIVETAADALALFIDRPIDVLVLGDRLVRKYSPWASLRALPSWQPQATN
ncbi:MAG: carbamoyltransferase C-terminal domain-containing protein [Microthrixaceae bacterium]